MAALAAENSAQAEELSAFDEAFFEEIEDLKWAHAQLARAFAAYLRDVPPPPGYDVHKLLREVDDEAPLSSSDAGLVH